VGKLMKESIGGENTQLDNMERKVNIMDIGVILAYFSQVEISPTKAKTLDLERKVINPGLTTQANHREDSTASSLDSKTNF